MYQSKVLLKKFYTFWGCRKILLIHADSIFQILSNKLVLDLDDLQDIRVQRIFFPAGQPLYCLISHFIRQK